MPLPLHSTLTVSCEASEEDSGPTLVHSTGVQSYRIQPEIIRFLQESCSNEKLADHEKGVQCTDPAAHIIETFERAGFTVTSSSTSGSRKIWMLTKTSDEGGQQPPHHGDDEHAEEGNEEEEQEDNEGEGEE